MGRGTSRTRGFLTRENTNGPSIPSSYPNLLPVTSSQRKQREAQPLSTDKIQISGQYPGKKGERIIHRGFVLVHYKNIK